MSLKEHLLDLIQDKGPIPFDEFMDLALYHPDGFFGGLALRSVKTGDFLTSPEVSRLFGATLARYVRQEQDRIGNPFILVEAGAGSGSLLRPLLEETPLDAWAVERAPTARAELASVLPGNRVVSSLDQLPRDLRGVVIANELLDNLPMALAQKTRQGWRERWVGREGQSLAFVDSKPRPSVLDWLGKHAGEVAVGDWVEVQLEAQQWLVEALGALASGSVLLFDYGDTKEGLLPRRSPGTLRTYRAHHLGPHPLDEPGETDITADVNFSALVATARSWGVAEVSLHRQDDFLSQLGLRDRLAELRHLELSLASSDDSAERLRVRSLKTEAETLLHPRGLGDFRVLRVTV